MKLSEIAAYVKSANAGPYLLTLDVGFRTEVDFKRFVDADVINPELISKLYPIDASDVNVYNYEPAFVIKITIPRAEASAALGERDFDGVQQFAPLLDIEAPH